jgi:hypothetical protein
MSDMGANREQWIGEACAGFASTKPANINYYRLILETLWQPLCAECNNFKSTACRGCQLECTHSPPSYFLGQSSAQPTALS